MKHVTRLMLVLAVLLAAAACASAKADVYGTLNQKMATRTGPSTKYDEPGTFFIGKWQGKRIKVISKVNTGVWWLQVEFEENGKLMRAYTGLKRLDGVNLNSVPEEKKIGTCRLNQSVIGRYGPGANYEAMGYSIPANRTLDVYQQENNYLQVEFPYQKSGTKYEKSRAWVPVSKVIGWGDSVPAPNPDPNWRQYVRTGVSWWTEEPEWSTCSLTFISSDKMSVALFFYRIAGIRGTITLDSGNNGNHGWLSAYFEEAPEHEITGEVWFTPEGLAIDMNAYQVDNEMCNGNGSFYDDSVFVYQYR